LQVGEGLNSSDFGTIVREDGSKQTTYKGWPLYYYVQDQNPGDVLGDGRSNVWFAAKPDYTIMLVNNQLLGNDGKNYTGNYTEGDETIQYFTDGKGRTLYTWTRDFQNTNKFTRPDFSNNANWPVYEEDNIVVPSILDASLFSSIDVHGRKQMTYKGWPLYYFGADGNVRGSNKGVSVPSPGVWPVARQNMAPAKPATVVDIVVNSEVHNTLEAAVIAAGLAETLSGDGPFTIFAPTDAAFAALPAGTVETLLEDPSGLLTQILLYHALSGKVMSTDLTNGMKATTLQGQDITVTINEEGVFINGAKVIIANIEAGNGVVHVIDAVLLPQIQEPMPATVVDIVVNSEVHNTLEAAVIAAGLAEALSGEGPFTLFAPTDAAFAALPAGTVEALLADPKGALTEILTYHALAGKVMSTDLSNGLKVKTLQGQDITVTINEEGVFINGAKVIIANIEAGNGVVHVIDAVLLPQIQEPMPATVVDIVVNSEVHNTLEAAVIAAGLVETLSGDGPFTIFAPTDAAFAALPAGTVEALLADPKGALTEILTYHALAGKVMSTDLSNGLKVKTLQGQDITVTINEEGVFINGAKVIIANIEAGNGVVHVIDAVLLPQIQEPMPATVVDIVVNSEVHNTLEAAVIAAGLAEALSGEGPFTLFAPTDAAFAALPAGTVETLLQDPSGLLTQILLYHALSGKVMSGDLSNGMTATTLQGQDITVTINEEGVFINGAKVIIANIEAANGVVHVIDAVLLPKPKTVVDIVVNSEVHNTLEAAVIAAGLAEALSGEGPFTLFAPTDAAFAALPAGTVEALLADPKGALTEILTYHALAGKVMSTDLSNGLKVKTLQGQDITVTINEEGVFINGAKVIIANIEAGNGVVHVIDAVLLPAAPRTTVVDVIVKSENHTTLEAAVIAAGLVETLSGDGPFTIFAPTDAAFAALPAGTVEALLADPKGALTDVLTYHAVAGKVRSTDLINEQKVVTLSGKIATVTINAQGVFINKAKVTVADIVTDNGVVHVIDAVLLADTPTNVTDITNSGSMFTMYPNPASSTVTFDLRNMDTFTPATLSVFTMDGRMITQIPANEPILNYDVRNLNNGLYIVVLKQNNRISTEKLIVR
jgi:transforming growth factor-beta-induced protein